MDVVKLKPGTNAPEDGDFIRVQEAEAGQFQLSASALEGLDEEAESIAMIRGEPYATQDDAEAAGEAWASDHGVAKLYVESGNVEDAD